MTAATQRTTPPATQDDSTPPSADVDIESYRLIRRMHEAMGGEERIKAIQSARTLGVIDSVDLGMKTTIEMFRMGPYKALVKQSREGFRSDLAINGLTAWVVENGVPAAAPFEAVHEQLMYFDMHSLLRDPLNYFVGAKYAGSGTFQGRPVEKVAFIERDAESSVAMLDKETGLCLGFELTRGGPVYYFGIVVALGEWRDYHGIRLPVSYTYTLAEELAYTYIYSEVEFNTVDPSQFAIPPVVPEVLAPGTPLPAATKE